MDALLLVILIFAILVMLGISIYLLVRFVHPDEKGFGTAVYCKILVVLGMILIWSMALTLPFDVANNHFGPDHGGFNMKAMWYAVYISSIVMIGVLLPLAMFFYETDEDKPICSRIKRSLCYLSIMLILLVTILMVSWIWLKYADIPVDAVYVSYNTTNSDSTDSADIKMQEGQDFSVEEHATMKVETSWVVYTMSMMAFVGWILLILFGGVGMFALPIDWINEWRNRPRPRRSDEMRLTKGALLRTAERLGKTCQELMTEDEQLTRQEQTGGEGIAHKIKKRQVFKGKLSEFRARYTVFQEECKIFKLELEYANTNPIIPWLKLFCGICFLITAILWIVQLIFGYLARKNDRPLIYFLNELLVYMERSRAGVIACVIYCYMISYLVMAVIKGNIKFGIRIPFVVRFYPMKVNQTWMNSFLFNIIMMLLASTAITQLATCCFPAYARNTAIYNMFGLQVNYMRFYKYFYRYKIFGIAFVSWSLLTLIYMLFTCNRLPRFAEEVEAIRRGHTRNADARNQELQGMEERGETEKEIVEEGDNKTSKTLVIPEDSKKKDKKEKDKEKKKKNKFGFFV